MVVGRRFWVVVDWEVGVVVGLTAGGQKMERSAAVISAEAAENLRGPTGWLCLDLGCINHSEHQPAASLL